VTDGRLPRAFWLTLDALHYWLTLAWLRILDALDGPEPETPADEQRERDCDRDQIAKAFPALGDEQPAARVPRRAERVRSHD